MKTCAKLLSVGTLVLLAAGAQPVGTEAQGQAPGSGRPGGAPAAMPAPETNKPALLEITTGTKARYRVREQLAGISFPSDAVGTTESVTGTIVINPDGTIDSAGSKITVDLRTITSDQQMRDGYVRRLTLETEKYPFLEFVPRRAVGLPAPFPSTPPAQAGFQLIGDMTLHGVTTEATWNVIATFGPDQVSGRATTTVLFTTYQMPKPTLARLISVDDKIDLEVEFRTKRSAR